MNTDQKIDKMADDMMVIMNNSARILSELTSQQQQISAFKIPYASRPSILLYVRVPVQNQKNGTVEKRFKQAILDLIRSEWRKSPVIGAPDKTEDDIVEAYKSIQSWSSVIASKCAPNLFQVDANGQCTMGWSTLFKQAQDAFIDELVVKANEIGVYFEHCENKWAARRFLQIAVNSKGRSIKKKMAATAGNVFLEGLSMPDDSMSFTDHARCLWRCTVNEPPTPPPMSPPPQSVASTVSHQSDVVITGSTSAPVVRRSGEQPAQKRQRRNVAAPPVPPPVRGPPTVVSAKGKRKA
ncbi:hypothetical protein [Absidia glauca]|uniref:Uncharacterized protein n=1 Tax=Absidia glauca TaxID=4829 RepID=A0A163TGB4_ABSGL|nr:hypothetical protein [Absidia glauca]